MSKPADAKPTTSVWATTKPFVNGGLSGMMATCIIQPIDMVKVRLQLGATGSPIKVASDIVKNDGVGGLYKGLSAGLLRQATYTTARLGIHGVITKEAMAANNNKPLPLYQKLLAGLTAGGLGALVGTPADLTLVRMQSDATLPAAERRNYKGIGDAFVRIVKEDGAAGLFRGAGPTIARAMSLNMGMFASNEQAKEMLAEATPMRGLPLTASASMIAGFFAAACSLPFDFVKTRLQRMNPDAAGKYPYSGFVDCFAKLAMHNIYAAVPGQSVLRVQTLTQEGPLRFYTGFPTYVVRIGPHVCFTLIFADMLPKWQKQIGL